MDAEGVKVLRVVVVGPSDVADEFATVRRVAEDLNQRFVPRGLALHVQDWRSSAHPGLHPKGPQGKIDSDLDIGNADLVIGVFWKSYGTPVDGELSGAAHEIYTAYSAWQQQQKPQMVLCFNQQQSAPPRSKDEALEISKLMDFKEGFRGKGLYQEYSGPRDFDRNISFVLLDLLLGTWDEMTRSGALPAGVLHCSVEPVPNLVRCEGVTELVGRLRIILSGLRSVFKDAVNLEIEVKIFLNTSITNRVGVAGVSDALMLIASRIDAEKYIQGRLIGSNALSFRLTLNRQDFDDNAVLYLTNVRANASALSISREPLPVLALIEVGDIPVVNPKHLVSYAARSVTVDLWDPGGARLLDPGGARLLQSTGLSGRRVATIRFVELFSSSLKRRAQASENWASVTQLAGGAERRVDAYESTNDIKTIGDSHGQVLLAGLADFGTRVSANFACIPRGVHIFVSTRQTASGSGLEAVLVKSETDAFSVVGQSAAFEDTPVAELTISDAGEADATWEIVGRRSSEAGYIEFGIFVAYESHPEVNSPALGTALIRGRFVPSSIVPEWFVSSEMFPVPRFIPFLSRDPRSQAVFCIDK